MAFPLLMLVALLAAVTGCNSACDSAVNVLEEKCGAAVSAAADNGESCEADSEIVASCVNDNSDKTCAEIQAACYGQ